MVNLLSMASRMKLGATLIAVACLSTAASAQTDRPLLQPGENPDQTIQLHMPTAPAPTPAAAASPAPHAHHAHHTSAPKPVASVDAIGADAGAPAEAPATRRVRATKAAPAPASMPFTFGEEEQMPASAAPPPSAAAAPPAGDAAPPPPRATRTASLPSHPAPRVAAQPNLATNDHGNLAKRGAVLFEKGMSDPSPEQFKGLKMLAGDLAAALEAGASRVQLEAYGGAPGDKSSDARRLSLKRALAVRQLLIDDGVPSARIDVRAMGGIEDKGPADRVDVFVRAG